MIVPETHDLAIQTTSIQSQESDRIYIELFGDSIICGQDPDAVEPLCGVCSNVDAVSSRVAQPPGRLLEFFLPQYKLVIITRSSGNSTSGQLLNGTDGVNDRWPDQIEANIVVVNHGMNDARDGVPIQEYKNNLVSLRENIRPDQIMVWQTPTINKYWDTNPYAEAMREVAAQYGDLVADANRIVPSWLGELPDGLHPRQLGYAELVDLCLSSQINSAVLRHFGTGYNAHRFYRKDYQEKFVLDEQDTVQLSFNPLVHRWVEVYFRDNLSFRAVSRGLKDIGGILPAGLWAGDRNERLVSTTGSYNLVRIRREDGRIVFNKNYNTESDLAQVKALADDLNATNNQHIVVITTGNDPEANRLTVELTEAMYRCGASAEIFASPLFKMRSSYILVGIPGCGQGNGLEAYGGQVDATDAATVPGSGSITIGTPKPFPIYYGTGTTNPAWSNLLNTYSIWQGNVSAEYNWQVFFPRPSVYTVTVSADNTATVYLAANTVSATGNITANSGYSQIMETVGTNVERYGSPQANSFTVPGCGWYDVKIYAEDFGDYLQTPLYYTPASDQTNWSSLLNTYGIYNGEVEDYQWEFYAPETGVYAFALSADNHGSLAIRPRSGTTFTTVIATPANLGGGAANYEGLLTASQTVTKGWYVIKMNLINTNGPGGIAATIRNPNGSVIWTTLDVRNPDNLGARGVAAIITDDAGVTIWNTRSARNAKEINEAPGQKTINARYSYSEIEFNISSSGVPFPIDIFPAVPNALGSSGSIEQMLTAPYEIVANVPPVNGTRLMNPKYAMHNTNGIPGDTYHITKDNKIKFSRPLTGVVTVVSDTVDRLSANAAVVKVQNIHSLTTYVQRFNPARWAFGSNITTVVEDSGNLATRTVDSATGVNSLGLYNTQLRVRVGDSHYAEPIVLDQPQHGYVRITDDRRHMAYVPFPDYAGLDAFTYTLLSQTGQAGVPKCVYVEVSGPVSTYGPYVPPPPPVVANAAVISVNSFVVNEQSPYTNWVVTGDANAEGKKVTLSLSGSATANVDYLSTLAVSTTGGNVWTAYDRVAPPAIKDSTLLVRVTMQPSEVVEIGESIILNAAVEGGNAVRGVATINNSIGLQFTDDWRYPEVVTVIPSITINQSTVWERSPYAIWVIYGDVNAEGKRVSLSLSGTATRGVDYASTLEVSEFNGESWSPYQPTNLPIMRNRVLLARVAMIDDGLIEVGETIILTAGISGGTTVRGIMVIDDTAGAVFDANWTFYAQ